MSLYVDKAERSNGFCQICGKKIMKGEQRLRVYSAHHAVSLCKSCAVNKLFEITKKLVEG